jgi:hypothetical protein
MFPSMSFSDKDDVKLPLTALLVGSHFALTINLEYAMMAL